MIEDEPPPSQHGLFVQPAHVKPLTSGSARSEEESSLPTQHLHAWSALEKTLEAEALQAGYEGERVRKHLEKLSDERQVSSTVSKSGARQA